jgi:hypothetical protein
MLNNVWDQTKYYGLYICADQQKILEDIFKLMTKNISQYIMLCREDLELMTIKEN